MDDPELARSLTRIHRLLYVIAFLLAVLIMAQGPIGTLVGGGAAALLALDALARFLDENEPNSTAG